MTFSFFIRMKGIRACRVQLVLGALLFCGTGFVPGMAAADEAAVLRNKYQSLKEHLLHNQFQRPLYLNSVESSSRLDGDIYAVVDYPFAAVNATLNDPNGLANWCDLLILHINTKYCHASSRDGGKQLVMNIGKKTEQELADTYPVRFDYHAVSSGSEYFKVTLNAQNGPMGTSDYLIALEALAIQDNRTFLHLKFSYRYGMAGIIAMKVYLATIGRSKVGFSTIGDSSSEHTQYIDGVRGVVERNTMRYYLAIDAYLSALSAAPEERLTKRLTRWYKSTEQYPRQLHEVDQQDYMKMKYREYQRQQMVRLAS